MKRKLIKAVVVAPFAWTAWIIFATVLQLIGFPLIAVLALFEPWSMLSTRYGDKRVVAAFPVTTWFWLWENDEDGIDGLPMINNAFFKNVEWMLATRTWSRWRRVFVWSAWRNSVNNQRFCPGFRCVIDPSQTHIRYFFKNSAYFVWCGLYSALYVTVGSRYIFIGYKIHQGDAQGGVAWEEHVAGRVLVNRGMPAVPPATELAADDARKPGAGFSFDLLKKIDPTSWETPPINR